MRRQMVTTMYNKDWYWPIDDQSIVTSASSLITSIPIDCQRYLPACIAGYRFIPIDSDKLL